MARGSGHRGWGQQQRRRMKPSWEGRWGSVCYFHLGGGAPSWPSEKHQLCEGTALSGREGIQTPSWPVEPTGCGEQMAQAWTTPGCWW